MRTCECGCGSKINKNQRYIHGHNRKGKSFPGRVLTEEHRRKIGNALRGRQRTDEARRNISVGARRRWSKRNSEERQPSKETKLKISLGLKRHMKKLDFQEKKKWVAAANKARQGCHHSEESRQKMREAHAGYKSYYRQRATERNRLASLDRPTLIEKILYLELQKRDISFEPQYIIGRYRVDAAILEPKIIIEVDGDYWHSLPMAKENDAIRDKELREQGWLVFRFSEDLVKTDIGICLDQLRIYSDA